MLLVGVSLSFPWPCPSARADDLTPQQQAELEKRITALEQEIAQLYQQGNYTAAIAKIRQSLELCQRLYPAAHFPDGHPDLAAGHYNLGFLLALRGEYDQAQPYLERALAMRQRLFPAGEFPDGHADLALSLSSLGGLLRERGQYARAQPYYEQALAMRRRLYPEAKYPQGHPDLALSLNNLGGLLQDRGEYAQAQAHYEQALAMYQRLFPPARYPAGHADLALTLHNLASLLQDRGEYARAQPYCEQALAMNRRLFPEAKYPAGHADLARSLNMMGPLLRARGQYVQAESYYEQALRMHQRLYPPAQYPAGHPDLALSLNNLASLLQRRRQYDQARLHFEQALAMYQCLYPTARYPDGHRELAVSLNNLGHLFEARGEYAQAQPYVEQALAMYQRLYPADKFPDGHRDLARCLINLGALHRRRGEYAEARSCYEKALAMQQVLTSRLLESTAFAEAFRYLGQLQACREALLRVTCDARGADRELYSRLWPDRSVLPRLLERRHASLLAAASRPEIRDRWEELLDTSRQLSRLFLHPPRDFKARDEQARALTGRKERLERELAGLLPSLAAQKELDALTPDDLQRSLPERAVFVDLWRYTFLEQDPNVPGKDGEKLATHYVAFVLTRDQVHRVELGEAEAIDGALEAWRQAIRDRRDDPAAAALRRRVWEPIAKGFPAGTDTVYLAPDGALTRLPWAALPGEQPGSVLLERYTLPTVPHGRYLLARLRQPGNAAAPVTLLAVGGVRYDDRPAPVEPTTSGTLVAATAPTRDGAPGQWGYLAGTEQEVQRLRKLAGVPVRSVSGADASTARLLNELPKARLAHLATHGFFAKEAFDEEQQRATRQLENWKFSQIEATQPVGLGSRNPLSFAGLVLAGANKPEQAGPDGGILTAEALIHLPLEGMDLAVLSACQTGLGAVYDGECVHSLQLAFHVAGCKDVVASLWNVPDQATAALMAVFYDELLRNKRPPLEALRQAQLTLYRSPTQIAELAKRGPILLAQAQPGATKSSGRAAVEDWAGFVLSGLGR
jgi:tetratricopeptide (TPR) repeat protein